MARWGGRAVILLASASVHSQQEGAQNSSSPWVESDPLLAEPLICHAPSMEAAMEQGYNLSNALAEFAEVRWDQFDEHLGGLAVCKAGYQGRVKAMPCIIHQKSSVSGSYQYDLTGCRQCATGQYSSRLTLDEDTMEMLCRDCPPGRYQSQPGQAQCWSCSQRDHMIYHQHLNQSVISRESCVCAEGYYDVSVFELRCVGGQYSDQDDGEKSNSVSVALKRAKKRRWSGHRKTWPSSCEPCGECAICPYREGKDGDSGIATLRPGWWVKTSTMEDPAPLLAFRCPDTNSCQPMQQPATTWDHVAAAPQMKCMGNRTGPLCDVCNEGFYRNASNLCAPCGDGQEQWSVFYAVLLAILLLIVILYAALSSLSHPSVNSQAKLKGLNATRGSVLSASAVCECCFSKWKAFSLVSVMLGWMQVLSLLPGVVDLQFPGNAAAVLRALSAISFNIRELAGFTHPECLGFQHSQLFYLRWLLTVVGVPAATLLATGLLFLKRLRHVRNKAETLRQAERRAAVSQAQTEVFFMGLLFWPQISTDILTALPVRCRQLGHIACSDLVPGNC